MTCMAKSAYILNGPTIANLMLDTFMRDAAKSEEGTCRGHLIWAVPARALLSIANLVLAPVMVLVNLICAAIFKIMSCCTEDADDKAELNFTSKACLMSSMFWLVDVPLKAIVSPFWPIPAFVTLSLMECMEQPPTEDLGRGTLEIYRELGGIRV